MQRAGHRPARRRQPGGSRRADHRLRPHRRGAPGEHDRPVETTQIAPTILSLLGIEPDALQAVRIEGTQVLPGTSRR
jgi:hypothetical protein